MCSPFLYSKSQMDKAVSDALDSTRKELEELRVLHKIAWINEKKLTEGFEELRENVNTMTVALKLCTQPLYSFEPIGAAYKAVKSALAAVEKKANIIKYGGGEGGGMKIKNLADGLAGSLEDYIADMREMRDQLASTRKELELNKKLLARQCDLARKAETETERYNPSGCCCQIDENNGDPQMVEPCAFHAEWRIVATEALRGKVQRFESVINSLGGIATLNIDLLGAYNSLCDVSQPGVRDGQAEKCTHPQGYIKSVRICGLCGEQR